MPLGVARTRSKEPIGGAADAFDVLLGETRPRTMIATRMDSQGTVRLGAAGAACFANDRTLESRLRQTSR